LEVRVESGFPFGLLRKSVSATDRDELVAGPRRAEIRPSVVPRLRGAARLAQSETSASPGSEEFIGLRDYVPGDSARMIAWRPSARLGSLVVRQMVASAPPTLTLQIDPHDASEPWRLERALVLAAAAAERAASFGCMIGLEARWAGVSVRPTADLSDGGQLLRALASIDPEHARLADLQAQPIRGTVLRVAPGGDADESQLENLLLAPVTGPELEPRARRTPAGVRSALARRARRAPPATPHLPEAAT